MPQQVPGDGGAAHGGVEGEAEHEAGDEHEARDAGGRQVQRDDGDADEDEHGRGGRDVAADRVDGDERERRDHDEDGTEQDASARLEAGGEDREHGG